MGEGEPEWTPQASGQPQVWISVRVHPFIGCHRRQNLENN